MTRDELKAELDKFSQAKIEFVATVVRSLSNPPRPTIRQQGTWLTGSPEWMEYFSLARSVHHGATTEPLGLTSFETVFRNACGAAKWTLDSPGSATRRFVDLEVVGGAGPARRLSLKSTAARNLAEKTAHISKLTEAAWIQDARTPRDRRATDCVNFSETISKRLTQFIMLRAFRKEGVPHRYQLLEIPTALFASVQEAPIAVFQRDAPFHQLRSMEESSPLQLP